MKFLCVPCDSPMTLQTVGPPEQGSLSVVYACPQCGYEMAMLTNPYETQIVQSLGVRIGPDRQGTGSAAAAPAGGSAESGGRCPFSGMIAAASTTGTGPAAATAPGHVTPPPAAVRWTAAAEARLANVPEFVRPMARTGIERFARDNGAAEVDESILDAAREFFGM